MICPCASGQERKGRTLLELQFAGPVGRAAAIVLSIALLAVWPLALRSVQAASPQYDSFWRQSTSADFTAWTAQGVSTDGTAVAPQVRLAAHGAPPSGCATWEIDGGAARSNSSGLCVGRDPKPRGDYSHGASFYNGGSFYFGSTVSPVHRPSGPIDHIIASWDAETPPGTWLEVHLRTLEGGHWSPWFSLGVWASDLGTIRRHSVDHQANWAGDVDTDTFHTSAGRLATAYQLSVTLFTTSLSATPTIRLVTAIASRDASTYRPVAGDPRVWGTDLPVPQRSQMLPRYRGLAYGGGGEVWCSPTSTSMIMAYWAARLQRPSLVQSVPKAAQGTYDATYDGTGNWPFNTAFTAGYGLTGFVTRMASMSQIEQWIAAGVPIAISVAFRNGELPGEPVHVSDGHLMVVRGFTRTGDVITNDPAASTDERVRIVFSRTALERVWRESTHGTAYVIYPAGWKTPTAKAFGSW